MDNGLRWHHPKRSTTLDKYMSNMFSILLIRFYPKVVGASKRLNSRLIVANYIASINK